MNWQNRSWLLLRTFVDAKDFGDILIADVEEWAQSEAKIFDARNYYLKGITHNYIDTSQISVVVARLQGFLSALRVSLSNVLKIFHGSKHSLCYSRLTFPGCTRKLSQRKH